LSKKNIRIEVDGEEDLATLPSIYLSPNRDVTIIYGMPDKGVVIVKTNDENKIKIKHHGGVSKTCYIIKRKEDK